MALWGVLFVRYDKTPFFFLKQGFFSIFHIFNDDMIYWTRKESEVTVRYRAYNVRREHEKFGYMLLSKDTLAEIYHFKHDETGEIFGMVVGEGLKLYDSKTHAFDTISEYLNKKE